MVQDLFLHSRSPVTRLAMASLQQSGQNQYQDDNGVDDGHDNHFFSRHDNEEMTKVDGFQEPGSFRQVTAVVDSFFSFHFISYTFPFPTPI